MIRREVFAAIGTLHPEYFFGFEDLDFCLRARHAGFACACIGDAVVLHEGSLSIGRQSARRAYFAIRNHLLLSSRQGEHQSVIARWMRAASIVALNLAWALKGSELPRREAVGGLVAGLRDYFAGRFGPAPADVGAVAKK
jgi:GT2 family glycosyltransferase